MGTSPNSGDEKNVPPDSSTVILLLLTIGSTTWRLFIPSIGFTVIGLLLDKQFKTTPWIMIIGIILGTAIAVLLIRSQMKKVKQQ